MFRVWQSTEKSCKTSGLEAEQGDEGGDVELEDDGDEVANEADDGCEETAEHTTNEGEDCLDKGNKARAATIQSMNECDKEI